MTTATLASSIATYQIVKRGMDIIISAILLALLSPVLLVVAIAIRLDSSGPALYRQIRVGEGGQTFTMLKFRTMKADNDSSRHRDYVVAFIKGKASQHATNSEALYKLVVDDRVTRVGHVLRKSSLDELPQLWNVLRGEMSLVGPRPPIPYEVEQYQPVHRERLMVKPGITGWWQVNGRSTTTFERMIELDLEYISNQSLRFDLQVLLKTIPTLLLRRGAI